MRHFVSAALVLVSGSSVAWAGPDWVEVGDAGDVPLTAQFTFGPTPTVTELRTISGALGSGLDSDFEDMYYIRVLEPGSWSIRPSFATFDATLYVFNLTVNFEGLGLLGNEEEDFGKSNVPRLLQAATDGTGVVLSTPGDYLVAIASAGRFPVSRTGAIFNFTTPAEISGPDGPGGFNPIIGWSGEATGGVGDYRVTLVSSGFPNVPAPGAAVLGVLGGVMLARRSRRPS